MRDVGHIRVVDVGFVLCGAVWGIMQLLALGLYDIWWVGDDVVVGVVFVGNQMCGG